MLEEASGLEGAELIAAGREPATHQEERRIAEMVERRLGGEPIQYVLGSWSFRGLDLFVDHRVLIPRPETELVVEIALEELARRGERRGASDPWTGSSSRYPVADLGTGSGAIALALVAELPDAEIWATDVDADALAVARANVAGSGALGARVRLAQGDWFTALPDTLRGTLRLVVSNPPYVARRAWESLPAEVRDHEPARALVSGESGLDDVERLVADGREWLAPGGVLVVEIGADQGGRAVAIARDAGYDAEVRHDLVGHDRVLVTHNKS